jgi:hypothetical protein
VSCGHAGFGWNCADNFNDFMTWSRIHTLQNKILFACHLALSFEIFALELLVPSLQFIILSDNLNELSTHLLNPLTIFWLGLFAGPGHVGPTSTRLSCIADHIRSLMLFSNARLCCLLARTHGSWRVLCFGRSTFACSGPWRGATSAASIASRTGWTAVAADQQWHTLH